MALIINAYITQRLNYKTQFFVRAVNLRMDEE